MHALAQRSKTERVDIGPLRFGLGGQDKAAVMAVRSAFASHQPACVPGQRLVDVTFQAPRAYVPGRTTMPTWHRVGDNALSDLSDAWDVHLTLAGPTSQTHVVDVQLVDVSERDDKLDLLVRGLVRVITATVAPFERALLVHGLGMVDPAGHAWVFLGESGAGKTTTAGRLPGWRRLSDDTVLLGQDTAGWYCAGTPFLGKERLPTQGARAALAGICLLDPHASQLAMSRLRTAAGFAGLSRHALWFTQDRPLSELLTDQLASLASDVPCFRLSSNLNHNLLELDWDRCRQRV